MDPEPAVALGAVAFALLHQEDAEHDLGEVAKVEGVVHLEGGGQQVLHRRLVHLQRAQHELLGHGRDVLREAVRRELPLQNGREDLRHVLVVQEREADKVEVAEHARRDEGAAAA